MSHPITLGVLSERDPDVAKRVSVVIITEICCETRMAKMVLSKSGWQDMVKLVFESFCQHDRVGSIRTHLDM